MAVRKKRQAPPMPTQRPERRQARDPSRVKPLEAGFQQISGDPVGYWAGDQANSEALYFRTIGVKIFDSKLDRNKPSCLLIVETTRPGMVYGKADENAPYGEEIPVDAGTVVGIWYKPGMKAVVQCHGVETMLDADIGDDGYIRELATGKPNPMALYVVASHGRGTLIPVLEDAREHSIGAKVPFYPPRMPRSAPHAAPTRRGPPAPEPDMTEDDEDDEDEGNENPF